MADVTTDVAVPGRDELDDDGWQVYDPSQWDLTEKGRQLPKGIHSQWINLEDIRQWIYACDYGHGESCKPSSHFHHQTSRDDSDVVGEDAKLERGPMPATRPLWLVDVVDQCIVPAENVRYIALSYVWGNTRGIEATQDNVGILLQAGALRDDNHEVIIPKTVRHAMELVNLLGERYLWVDRLCIVQDDSESKHSQLALMGNIFQSAYFTIIAANGWDADHGLRGIRGVTEPRQLSSELPDEEEYMRHIDREETIWYSRGWTFQEMFFSTRRLYFLYQYAVWECSKEVWHETTGVTGSLPALTDGSASGNKAALKKKFHAQSNQQLREMWRGPDETMLQPLQAYLSYAREYNSRALTYPEDGVNAFLGITSRMTEYFPGGFLYGLPINAFDIALLWQPFEVMTRRQSRRDGVPQLPSWSWVGWQGRIHWDCWKEEYQSKNDPEEPNSSFTALRAKHTTLITPIAEFLYVCDGEVNGVKTAYHVLQTDTSTLLSRQPSPVLSVRAPLARVKLWKGGLVLGAGFYLRERGGFYHWITLPDSTSPSPQCGVLFMQLDLHTQIPDVTECELIVLSRATSSLAKESSWLIIRNHYPPPDHLQKKERYEYYNVMWITRKDGVAYRKAIGKIATAAWDSLSPQWHFLSLG